MRGVGCRNEYVMVVIDSDRGKRLGGNGIR